MHEVIKQQDLVHISQRLQEGAVAVLRTDTLYGLVCSAHNKVAVKRVYALKHREKKPGTIIAASIDQLVELGFKKRYLTAVEQYWPGAISIVIPTTDPELVYLHDGLGSVAMRVVAGPAGLVELLQASGPLLTTSANLAGEKPAETVQQAIDYFGDAVDAYMDGGYCENVLPSTIVRVVDDTIEVLREGAVSIDEPK